MRTPVSDFGFGEGHVDAQASDDDILGDLGKAGRRKVESSKPKPVSTLPSKVSYGLTCNSNRKDGLVMELRRAMKVEARLHLLILLDASLRWASRRRELAKLLPRRQMVWMLRRLSSFSSDRMEAQMIMMTTIDSKESELAGKRKSEKEGDGDEPDLLGIQSKHGKGRKRMKVCRDTKLTRSSRKLQRSVSRY